MLEITLDRRGLLLFGCLYRSPTRVINSDINNASLNDLLKNLGLSRKYSHKCIVGDFNYRKINWRNWSTPLQEDSEEEKFLDALQDAFLYQHINEPTRRRRMDEPSTLDLVFTGEDTQISNLVYHAPLGKSDHSVISFNFNCYFEQTESTEIHIYDKADFDSIRQTLDDAKWKDSFKLTATNLDVNECWKILKNKLTELRDQYIPKGKVGDPAWKSKGQFPIKLGIRQLIKEKRSLHRKWIKSLNSPGEESIRKQYKKIRNKVKQMISKTKTDYEKDICNQSKKQPKTILEARAR